MEHKFGRIQFSLLNEYHTPPISIQPFTDPKCVFAFQQYLIINCNISEFVYPKLVFLNLPTPAFKNNLMFHLECNCAKPQVFPEGKRDLTFRFILLTNQKNQSIIFHLCILTSILQIFKNTTWPFVVLFSTKYFCTVTLPPSSEVLEVPPAISRHRGSTFHHCCKIHVISFQHLGPNAIASDFKSE